MKFLIMKRGLRFVFSILLLNVSVAFSQPAFLDQTFGNGGKVVTTVGSLSISGSELSIQPDGKILAVGTYQFNDSGFVLVRYNIDGALDSSFGNIGKVVTPFGPGHGGRSYSLAIQSDGKIVVGGTYAGFASFALVRYKPNGTIDSSFGNNGFTFTQFGTLSIVFRILIKPDGKILAGGYIRNNDSSLSVLQYTSQGLLDSTFGINGIAKTPKFSSPVYNVYSISLQNDLKIIVSGNEVFRFMPNGSIDNSYGMNGKANVLSGGNCIKLQPDGKCLVVGSQSISQNQSAVSIKRIKIDGNPDSTFGVNGYVNTSVDSLKNEGEYLQILPNGKFLIAAGNYIGNPSFPGDPTINYRGNFVLLQYNNKGTLDSTFGINGIITNDFGLQDDPFSMVIQADGKIILSGRISDSSNYKIGLVRYGFNALPLHLLTFTAHKQGNTNLLQWQTAQEINVDHFIVERSSNPNTTVGGTSGREFSTIGKVKAGSTNYSFTDNNPLKATNYYRLKMVDKDGQYTYSPIRSINNSGTFSVSIYPNPAKDNLQIQIESDKPTTLQLQIISQEGKVLLSHNTTATAGSILRSINISALAKGSYFLRATSTENQENNVKFEKL